MENSHGPPGVREDCPFFSRPCPPFGRPCQMAEPVLSVAAGPPARFAPGGSPAPAAGSVVSTKAWHARRPKGSRPSSFRPIPDCSDRLILWRLVPRRRRRWRRWCLQLLLLLLLLHGDRRSSAGA